MARRFGVLPSCTHAIQTDEPTNGGCEELRTGTPIGKPLMGH